MTEYKYVGKPRKLIDGLEKVTGHLRFTADLSLPNMLYARLVLSPYAHARIVSIDKTAAESLPGVVAVLTAEDLPTRQRLISSRNSAVLAKGKVLWCGQPVAVVVGETVQAAQDGVVAVQVGYEPLPAVVDMRYAIQPEAPAVWEDGLPQEEMDMTAVHGGGGTAARAKPVINNVHGSQRFKRGDVQQGLAEADLVLERVYQMAMVHQGYLEPHAGIAQPEPLGRGLTVYASTQGQFGVRSEVSHLMGLSESAVRVVPMPVGGGFGAKYGIIDPLTSAVALVMGQPVQLVLSRSEDFLATTPAPPITVELKTGAKKDGRLTSLQARILLDNGVFSFQLGWIAANLLGGYYKWQDVDIETLEINTHKPQGGAYRAPTAPHVTFAIESQIDEMARLLNLDPLEMRLQNAVEEGDLSGTGRKWPNIGLKLCLERLREHPLWQNRHQKQPDEGIGLAIGGWPSNTEPAAAICRVDGDGTVNIHVGAVDISGVNSSFVLVAAEILDIPPDQVRIVSGDTHSGPYSPGSGGSQITYSVAGAVAGAAQAAREKLVKLAAQMFEADVADIEFAGGQAWVRGVPARKLPIQALAKTAQQQRGGLGPIVGEGTAAKPQNAPGFVAHLIKVKVDRETGEVTPLHYVTVQDVGFALNPLLVQGQMHGGAAQGVGIALYEAMCYDKQGQLLTGSFMDYALPRADMLPTIETIMVENPSPHGPFGVRGIGEPPVTAGGAAVGNAIRDALGVRVTELPLRPEVVWKALQS